MCVTMLTEMLANVMVRRQETQFQIVSLAEYANFEEG